MKSYATECDSCENVIAGSDEYPMSTHNLMVTIPTGERETYEDRNYELCAECRRQIVDFVEGCDESDTRVDMLDLEDAERGLEEFAEDLELLGERIGDFARGDTDESP